MSFPLDLRFLGSKGAGEHSTVGTVASFSVRTFPVTLVGCTDESLVLQTVCGGVDRQISDLKHKGAILTSSSQLWFHRLSLPSGPLYGDFCLVGTMDGRLVPWLGYVLYDGRYIFCVSIHPYGIPVGPCQCAHKLLLHQ